MSILLLRGLIIHRHLLFFFFFFFFWGGGTFILYLLSSMCLSLGAEAFAGAVMIEFRDEVSQPANHVGLVYLIRRCQLNVVISNKCFALQVARDFCVWPGMHSTWMGLCPLQAIWLKFWCEICLYVIYFAILYTVFWNCIYVLGINLYNCYCDPSSYSLHTTTLVKDI